MSREVNLKSLLQFTRDGEWGKSEPFDNSLEMKVIRGTDFEDVREGRLDNVPTRYIAQRFADYKTLQPNDILLETAGGSKDRPTGRTLFIKPPIIHKADFPLTCASFARFLRVDPSQADPAYLFWHLQYMYETGHMLQYHTQHTGVARFQYTTFAENEPLFLPPLPTQRKIAAVLSAYDDLIENNSRRIAILEEMAHLLYREWFVEFRYPGHESAPLVESALGPVPEGWEVVKLGETSIQMIDGDRSSRYPKRDQLENEGILFLNTTNINSGKLDLSSVNYISPEVFARLSKGKLKPFDIIITTRGSVGKVALFDCEYPTGFINAQMLILRSDNDEVDQLFLLYLLYSAEFQDSIKNFASGAAQPQLPMKDLKQIPFLCPPLELQRQFSDIVQKVQDIIKNFQQRNQTLRQTRDLLLPRLISGELDVAGLDIAGVEE